MEKQQAYHLTENLIRSTTPISQRSITPLINNNKNEKTLSTSSSHSYLKGSSSSTSSPITLPPLSHISPLPTNAIIFHSSKSPQDDDHTFHKYMDQQFQKDASVLLKNQQPQKDNNNNNNNNSNDNDNDNDNISIHEPSTLWSALQTDLNEIKKNHEKIFYKEGDHHLHDHEEHIDRPWWTFDQHDGFFSIGAILFLFGFIFPPLWWLGSFWPKQSHRGGKMARRWQQLNRYFSIGFSILVVILIIVFAALYSTHQYT